LADERECVGIAGAGAIALGTAAFLERAGHRPVPWSPSGERPGRVAAGEPLVAEGAVEGELHSVMAARRFRVHGLRLMSITSMAESSVTSQIPEDTD
jgi:hypothetical protein